MSTDPRREPGFADDPERAARAARARDETPVPARASDDRPEWDDDNAPRARARDPRDPRITGEMSFFEHLEDLRKVLFRSVVATLIGALAGWLLAPVVMEDILRRTVGHAIVLSPLEAFNERLKLAVVLGLFMALPIVLWQVWSFIVPGLLKRERSWIPGMVLGSLVLFALGAWAAYDYVVPLVVKVMNSFLTPSMVAQIQLSAVLGFVYNMALACGLVFQLPLVTMTLTAIGLVTPGMLLRQWRYAIVGAFVVTAIITPGDVVTAQIVMGGPMVLLYFLSVGLSYLVARRKAEDAAADSEEADRVPQS